MIVEARLRRQPGPGFHVDLQLVRRLHGLPLLLEDDADEVLLDDDLDEARHAADGALVDTARTVAPTVGGRTTRPCTIPGTRTLCTYSNRPVTISGMSRRLTGVPSTVHSRGACAWRSDSSVMLNFLPPISSP